MKSKSYFLNWNNGKRASFSIKESMSLAYVWEKLTLYLAHISINAQAIWYHLSLFHNFFFSYNIIKCILKKEKKKERAEKSQAVDLPAKQSILGKSFHIFKENLKSVDGMVSCHPLGFATNLVLVSWTEIKEILKPLLRLTSHYSH